MLKSANTMWVITLDFKNENEKCVKRHKLAQAVASVPDKDGTLCSSVQFRGEYFLLRDPASLSKSNLQGWGTEAEG